MAIDRFQANSSNITGATYDDETQRLEIEFASGGVYAYSGVPASSWDGLKASGSPGSYFHTRIKGRHGFEKIG